MMSKTILDDQQIKPSNLRRRDLLPTWIKVFTWIFLIFGAAFPIALIAGITGMNFYLGLYGLETTNPISLTGISITFLFGFKGIVAYGLWMEKEWAVNLAIIDAIIGIIVCVFTMVVLPFIVDSDGIYIGLRLELIPLILYLIKMRKIKPEWIGKISNQ